MEACTVLYCTVLYCTVLCTISCGGVGPRHEASWQVVGVEAFLAREDYDQTTHENDIAILRSAQLNIMYLLSSLDWPLTSPSPRRCSPSSCRGGTARGWRWGRPPSSAGAGSGPGWVATQLPLIMLRPGIQSTIYVQDPTLDTENGDSSSNQLSCALQEARVDVTRPSIT